MENHIQRNDLFSYFACFTFIVFFSRIGEIFNFLAAIHINLLSFMLTFLLFLVTGAYNTIDWSRNRAIKLIALFLIIGGCSVPFAVWPTNSMEIWRSSLLVNCLICFFCLSSIQNERQLIRLVQAFLMGTFLLVSKLLINPNISATTGRSFVTDSYDPNDIAIIFAVTFPLVFGQFLVAGKKGRLLLVSELFMLIVGILKTGSRGGLLALAVAVLLIFFSSVVKVKIRYKALLVVGFAFFLFSPAAKTVLERWNDVLTGRDYNVADTVEGGGGRIGIWKAGLKLFGENFLFGVGVGNSSTAMGERYGKFGWMTMHNTLLQVAVELGIGGIIVFLLMLRAIWSNCEHVIKMEVKRSLNNKIFILAYSLRIALITFMVASLFLSQAYSLIIPIFLVCSNRMVELAQLNCTVSGVQYE